MSAGDDAHPMVLGPYMDLSTDTVEMPVAPQIVEGGLTAPSDGVPEDDLMLS